MPTQPYNGMTIDELDIKNAQLKNEVNKINEERDKIAEVRNRKVEQMHLDEAIKQLERVAKESDRTVDEVASDWIDDGDRGHYIQARLYFASKENK